MGLSHQAWCVGVTLHPCLSGGGVGSGTPWAVVGTFTNPGRRELRIRNIDIHDISLPVSAGAGVEVEGFLTPPPGSFSSSHPVKDAHCAAQLGALYHPKGNIHRAESPMATDHKTCKFQTWPTVGRRRDRQQGEVWGPLGMGGGNGWEPSAELEI